MDFGEVPSLTKSKGRTRTSSPRSEPAARQNDSALHGPRSYGVVYANELASKAYSSAQPQVFPVGSIIVREKLSQPNATLPDLLAVMIKREQGFNPAAGDWLFLTVNGTGSTIKQRMKKGACLDCHVSARSRDFVFELK